MVRVKREQLIKDETIKTLGKFLTSFEVTFEEAEKIISLMGNLDKEGVKINTKRTELIKKYNVAVTPQRELRFDNEENRSKFSDEFSKFLEEEIEMNPVEIITGKICVSYKKYLYPFIQFVKG